MKLRRTKNQAKTTTAAVVLHKRSHFIFRQFTPGPHSFPQAHKPSLFSAISLSRPLNLFPTWILITEGYERGASLSLKRYASLPYAPVSPTPAPPLYLPSFCALHSPRNFDKEEHGFVAERLPRKVFKRRGQHLRPCKPLEVPHLHPLTTSSSSSSSSAAAASFSLAPVGNGAPVAVAVDVARRRGGGGGIRQGAVGSQTAAVSRRCRHRGQPALVEPRLGLTVAASPPRRLPRRRSHRAVCAVRCARSVFGGDVYALRHRWFA